MSFLGEVHALGDLRPRIPESCFIAPGAQVIGDVGLGERVGVWFNAVLRGDVETLSVGDDTNIQDCSVLHADPGQPLTIGRGVTVGHKAMLHGCSIADHCLIGINAVVLNGATLGEGCIVGANALVTEGKSFPPRSLIVGTPAKAIREVDDATFESIRESAAHYVENARRYLAELKPLG
ncbi:MAG: gamma carbonic anhydrase family protein [Xanthomonadales bacterium]|nr:gamma carbonic anhydrase family protein [Xanthomonadales bacterium]